MQMFILYGITLILFLAIDVVGISTLIRPVFERHVGDIMADPLRLGPAAGFYAAYIVGVLYFASIPAITKDSPITALISGALFGLMCYGTYEFTNLATLRGWSWQQVALDTVWGGALTGVSAWAGVVVTRWVT